MNDHTPPLPTRSQLELLMEFVASYAGSAYRDDAEMKLREWQLDGSKREGKSTIVARVPQRAVAQHREDWLREHWTEMIDYMVDSECALEDPVVLGEKACPSERAHGEHDWEDVDLSLVRCRGVKAHKGTAIGGRSTGIPAMYGQIDVGPLTGGADYRNQEQGETLAEPNEPTVIDPIQDGFGG